MIGTRYLLRYETTAITPFGVHRLKPIEKVVSKWWRVRWYAFWCAVGNTMPGPGDWVMRTRLRVRIVKEVEE